MVGTKGLLFVIGRSEEIVIGRSEETSVIAKVWGLFGSGTWVSDCGGREVA